MLVALNGIYYLGRELVPYSTHRMKILWCLWFILEIFSKSEDVIVDCAG
jgi:hypothetical protein